mmetsp:Transcript_44628/g.97103  ORF Transcript_44628/g.97103 Transcript_44628/m.97103 type:complete len:821 (+) Transcript_44628:83-2545(+)
MAAAARELPARFNSMDKYYSAMADDGSKGGKNREAAALLVFAGKSMDKMAYPEAEKAALDALASFKSAGDKVGCADALRVVTQVFSFQGKGKEAMKMVKEELDKGADANMQLAYAESTFEEGSEERDEAEKAGLAALASFKASGDNKFLAATYVALANLYIKRSGDKKKGAEDAKNAVNEAIPLFKALGDTKGEALALHAMASARMLSGATEGAIRAAKEALALFQKEGIKNLEAAELHCIASWYLTDGDFDEAMALAEEAMDIYQEGVKADIAEAAVLQTIVTACLKKNQPQTALRAVKDTLERFEESGDMRGEAATYGQMCEVYCAFGDADRAIRSCMNAADTFEGLDEKGLQAKEMRTMCRLYTAMQDHEKALRMAQQALELFEQIDDIKEQAMTLQMRANVYMDKQEHSSALRCITEARELYQDAQAPKGETEALLQLADAQMRSEDWSGALKSASEAQALAEEAGDSKTSAIALRIQADIHITQEDLDNGMRCADKAVTLFREVEDRAEEVNMMVTLVSVRIMTLVKKDKDGKATAKSLKDGSDKVMKLAKEALSTAKKENDKSLVGAALYAVCQVHLMNGNIKDALRTGDEALANFQQTGDERYEANVLTLQGNVYFHARDLRQSRMKAEEAVFVFQKLKDARGEEQGWEVLDAVDKLEAEQREAEQQAQMMQWQAQQAMQQPGGLVMTPLAQQPQGGGEEEAVSQARGSYDPKLAKLDLSSGMDAVVIRNQVHEITKGIIGFDEDIEYDMPLMESGLTSNTAVLLRDALVNQLPGIPLPVTLIFDYPSIQSMVELIVENGEKAAKKAARAALK